MRFKNIVFFYPSKATGGAEYYFIRMAQYLSQSHKEYCIYYTDFSNGWARNLLDGYDISFLDYKDGIKTEIPENSVVCISMHLLPIVESLINYNRDNSIYTMWFMHFRHFSQYFTMDNYYKVSEDYIKKVGEELVWLRDNGLLKFLGVLGQLKLSQQFFYPYKDGFRVPIPISAEKYGIDCKTKENIGDTIRFTWLGRLDKEKSRNILTYMNELEYINKKRQVSLTLIGLGPCEEELKNQSLRYSYPITFVGEKREEQLDSFIRENSDIGLASGTSSLEFAIRKVPVIQEWILDKIYPAGVRQTYHFVDENLNIVDVERDSFKIKNQDYFSFKLNQILSDYQGWSDYSYNCAKKYSMQNCGESFVNAIHTVQNIDLKESYVHIDKLAAMTEAAWHNWMEKLHLRRPFVILCKLFSVKPAVF